MVGDDQRILMRDIGIGLADPAVFQKAVDHVVAALDRTRMVTHRMKRAGAFGSEAR